MMKIGNRLTWGQMTSVVLSFLAAASMASATILVYQPVQDEAANTTKVQGYEQWYYQGYRETSATPSTDPTVDGPLSNLNNSGTGGQWTWTAGLYNNPRVFASGGNLIMLSERSGPSEGNWTIGASVVAWEVPVTSASSGFATIDFDYDLPGTTASVDWFLVQLKGSTRTVLLSSDNETGNDGGSNISFNTADLYPGNRIELWLAPGQYNAVHDEFRFLDSSTLTFTGVPEPGTVLLLALGGGIVAWVRRRR